MKLMLEKWYLVMVKYIPFLKAKSNEVIALGELEPEERLQVIPFFDLCHPWAHLLNNTCGLVAHDHGDRGTQFTQ